MAQSVQLICAFGHNVRNTLPVDGMVNQDTNNGLKERIQGTQGLHNADIDRWILYCPGSVLDKDADFVPRETDCRLYLLILSQVIRTLTLLFMISQKGSIS